ncbi:phosphotransferase family protein [Novosphingobium sp. HII-3]|uniref:phosphotransferase family protein n=1 Tax=Novosphingobium sp. HII-3 TaxID=2075565 RepID=UPI001304A4FD|nr:phosphotransferase family protein [Novosphingobium sp. HII-3]
MLSGGASQETWFFELVEAGDGPVHRLVLRRAPGGCYQHATAAGLEVEAAVIRIVGRNGIPVPTVRYVLEHGDGIGRGFVTDHVDGETIARKILRDDAFARVRPTLPAAFGSLLARIHAVPKGELPQLRLTGAAATLNILRNEVRRLDMPRPVFEVAIRWLEDHMLDDREPALVHGDFRLGNLIIDGHGVAAVLDWELVHLGDPMEDIAWLCATPWRFGAVDKPVGGLGTREDLFASYEAAGGAIDRARLRWWDVSSALRWGVNCAAMVAQYRDGTDTSLERAMIARRASENEVDLMRLLYLGD